MMSHDRDRRDSGKEMDRSAVPNSCPMPIKASLMSFVMLMNAFNLIESSQLHVLKAVFGSSSH